MLLGHVSVEITFGSKLFHLTNCSTAWAASLIAVVGTTTAQATLPALTEIPNKASALSLIAWISALNSCVMCRVEIEVDINVRCSCHWSRSKHIPWPFLTGFMLAIPSASDSSGCEFCVFVSLVSTSNIFVTSNSRNHHLQALTFCFFLCTSAGSLLRHASSWPFCHPQPTC